MKRCSGCGTKKRRKFHRYCGACYNAYRKRWRAENEKSYAELSKDGKQKRRAYSLTHRLIKKTGRKDKCSVCRTDYGIEYHHPDYSQPHIVIPLCRKHHRRVHRERRAA